MNDKNNVPEELLTLPAKVKQLLSAGDYKTAEIIIEEAMKKFPHAPHPHNLMGILLYKKGEDLLAIKHFRAAWALNPAYLPSSQNLTVACRLPNRTLRFAYEEKDCSSGDKK